MKITVNTLKPRNPMVVPARFRRAGRHPSADQGQRQQARRALRRELDQIERSPP